MNWIKQLSWYRIPALIGGVALCIWGIALLLPHIIKPPNMTPAFIGDSLLYNLDVAVGSAFGLFLLVTGIAILWMLRLSRVREGCLSRAGVIGLFGLGFAFLCLIVEILFSPNQLLIDVLVTLYLFLAVCLAGAEHIGPPAEPTQN